MQDPEEEGRALLNIAKFKRNIYFSDSKIDLASFVS